MDKARTLFNAADIAAVVVLRAAGREKEISSSPGYWMTPYYGSFWEAATTTTAGVRCTTRATFAPTPSSASRP